MDFFNLFSKAEELRKHKNQNPANRGKKITAT